MRAALLAALLAASVGCDKSTPSVVEPVVEAPPIVLTPHQRIVQLQAGLAVVTAMETSTTQALRAVENVGKEAAKAPPPEFVSETTRKFTVFFGGNNHGERNDCGCRKNPLGGLGRRHTMLNALQNDDATEIWGESGRAIGPVFHADSGDSLFANNTTDRAQPDAQALAKYDAVSVVRALATFPPDAYGVGEHDLVFGLDYLKELTSSAGFPLISANLRGPDGELAFAPSVVVERDGIKVGFVGLTNKETRRVRFYEDRKLTVDEPLDAARKAIESLPSVDAVVLLSNIGRDASSRLVANLRAAGVRVELVIASSTNGVIGDPDFSAGVPVMEPMSRGKYLGRVDIWLNGAETEYRNASVTTPAALNDYRRAVRSYWSTRKEVFRERLKIAELESSLATLQTSQQKDAGAVPELTKRRTDTIDAQRKRLEVYETRRTNTADAMLLAMSKVQPVGAEPSGDDWMTGVVVPVKIEFVGEASTRKLLDAREKKRPELGPRGKVVKLPDR